MEPKSSNGITGKAREALARLIDHVLEEECSLSAATRDYRWRLTGPNLYSLHRLFEEQRQQLDYWLDQVIARTKSLGLRPRTGGAGTAAAGRASAPGPVLAPRTIIDDLLGRHETLAQELRVELERLRDPAMTDLLRRLQEFHETAAWMLRMLQSGPEPAA